MTMRMSIFFCLLFLLFFYLGPNPEIHPSFLPYNSVKFATILATFVFFYLGVVSCMLSLGLRYYNIRFRKDLDKIQQLTEYYLIWALIWREVKEEAKRVGVEQKPMD